MPSTTDRASRDCFGNGCAESATLPFLDPRVASISPFATKLKTAKGTRLSIPNSVLGTRCSVTLLGRRGVTLFDALQAFFQEHQYCGELDGGVEGDRVWMTCTCGVVLVGPRTR
jgi:hypothetical protein